MVDVEEISATEFQESEGLDTTVRSSIVKNIFLSSIFLIFLPNSLIEAIYDSSWCVTEFIVELWGVKSTNRKV